MFNDRKELDFNLEFEMIGEAWSHINKSMFMILLGLGERAVFYGWNCSCEFKLYFQMYVCVAFFLVVGKNIMSLQVSSLEQLLERARAALQDEVRNRERDVQEKEKELQEMIQQNAQLSDSTA